MAEKKKAFKLLKQVEAAQQGVAEQMGKAVQNNQVHHLAPPELRSKLERISRNSEDDYLSKLNAIMTGKMPPPVSYEDGDQTPLKGNEAQFLRNQWAQGMDYQPQDPSFVHLSSWLRCIWAGDVERFETHIAGKSEEEVQKLLNRRESLLNVGALVHVIHGARVLLSENPNFNKFRNRNLKMEHMKIFDKLISLGADINARDVAGYTPLHLCMNELFGNNVTKEMALKLLSKGADVNAKNRFGDTALMQCTIANKVEYVSFLLDHGADPDVGDNDGYTPRRMARLNQVIKKLFGAQAAKKAKADREEIHAKAGGNFKQCKVCKSYRGDTKRCTGCFLVWYCSPVCQKEDWESHKVDCQQTRKEYLPIFVDLQDPAAIHVGRSLLTGKAYTNVGNENKVPQKSHFIVKIQVPLDHPSMPMMVYNKDKSFIGEISKNTNAKNFDAIFNQIKKNGYMGAKGYFYAINKPKSVDVGGKKAGNVKGKHVEVQINTIRMLPVENW